MFTNDSAQDAERLEFRRPFWSGWKTRLVFCVLLPLMTVMALRSDQVTTASWVSLVLAWYSLIYWLRRDFRDLQESGGRFVVDEDCIRSSRFGREVSISWLEITKVAYGAAHLRLVSPTERISVPTNLPGYDRLHRFVYAHVPSAALETTYRLPIRVRYEVTSAIIGGALMLWFILLSVHSLLSPSDYAFSEALLILVPVVGLFVWLAGMGVYRAMATFEFHGDRIVAHTPFKKREYSIAGLLDMYLDSKSDQDTVTELNFILSGGEYLTVMDGNPSVGELYQILKPHYLPSERVEPPQA